MHLLDEVTFQPIFILGFHRSGTSILYKMLQQTGCFNSVTVYHLLRFHELLYNDHHQREPEVKQTLSRLFKDEGIGDREIDRLQIDPDFAEEYGFLLTELDHPVALTDENLKIFQNLCKKITYLSRNDRPLLLKNPFDFTNFMYIKRKFSNARFIFVHRNPITLLNSQMNVFDVLLHKKNPYTALLSKKYDRDFSLPFLVKLVRMCNSRPFHLVLRHGIRQTHKGARAYMNTIKQLAEHDYVAIRYEDLCQNPDTAIGQIMKSLKLAYDYDFRGATQPRNLDLFPAVMKRKTSIAQKMNAYFSAFDYTDVLHDKGERSKNDQGKT